MSRRERGTGLGEALAVWALFGVATLVVFATYSRLPADELYNVSGEGVAAGAGRAVVFLNYPVALAAIALAAIAADRLGATRTVAALGALAVLLCATAALPGVLDPSDLDARWVNAVPASGVALALALTVAAALVDGVGFALRRGRGDAVRLGLAALLVIAALPWWSAEAGFYIDDVPLLGAPFMSDELRPEPGHPNLRAVHLGSHHGTHGVLFALTALLLSRALAGVRRARLRVALGAYVSLMLVYGVANAAQDFWLEQIVKRGWTDLELPDMLRPSLTVRWGVIAVAAVAVYAICFRPRPQE